MKTNKSWFTRFWGKILNSNFHPCKKFDILQVWEHIQDNYIGSGGKEGRLPVKLWSQFEAVFSDEDTCQSILLQGLKNALNTESSQEELVWATIGRFGLEEELQAVLWREALLEVEVPGQLDSPFLCFII